MPYIIRFALYDESLDDEGVETWREPNKDEVIDRLIWILRRLEYPVEVIYPDGSRW
jgi:hypothetical protein